MKEIYIRTITGVIFVVAVLGSILFNTLAFFGLMFIFCFLALNEFFLITQKNESRKNNVMFFVFGMLIYTISGLVGLGYLDIRFVYLIFLTIPLILIFGLFKQSDHVWRNSGIQIAGWFYIALPFGLMNALFLIPTVEGVFVGLLIGLFVITWTSDVFAYLVGTAIGKHKLFERISPKKSWEGSFGGLAFALVAAYVLSLIFPTISLTNWLILSAIIAITGTFGDLTESMLKREAGVKDSGNLLPGHGGILDRFDAVLFAVPFVFIYVNLF